MAISGYSPSFPIMGDVKYGGNIANLSDISSNGLLIRFKYSSSVNADNSSTLTLTPQWTIYKKYNQYGDIYFRWDANLAEPLYISVESETTAIAVFNSTNAGYFYSTDLNGSSDGWIDIPGTTPYVVKIPHNADGTKTASINLSWNLRSTNSTVSGEGKKYIGLWYKYYDMPNMSYQNDESITSRKTLEESFSIDLELSIIEPKILTATAFTDETNPTITYSNPNGNNVSALEACISLTGGKDDVAYRAIPKTGTSYTFTLTETEKNTLRVAAKNATTIPVRFYLRSTYSGNRVYYHFITQNFTVANCNPIINNPTVKDIKPETLALTGDANKIVRYESMVEYSFEPVAKKSATITSQYIQCGNKKVSGLNQGVIDDVESNLFVFSATDSRGLTTQATITKTLVSYVKPTCYQTVRAQLSGETSGVVELKVHGNYFNGSFGVVSNTLKLEVRYGPSGGTMGSWQVLSGTPYFNGNTYELETSFTGFDYTQSYVFQCRATDKLNVVQSSQYTAKVLPIFDWSKEDFNFNVPVSLDGKTVLRHTIDTNNTVLSATGGHIYLRPKGTDDTTNEAIIYPDGSVNFTGAVKSGGADILTTAVNSATSTAKTYTDNKFNPLNTTVSSLSTTVSNIKDYITATGTTSMGSNGTWYWTKWNSGKAECYGCRNFGAMAISTYSDGGYYSASSYTQALPSGLFTQRPDFINISVVDMGNSNNYWICKISDTAPSASNTGGFRIHSKGVSSHNAPSSYIGFHVIGRWK